MKCYGRNLKDHCCYINGKPCKFLEINTEEGHHFSCQLRRENGSWDAVIIDPRYFEGKNSPGETFKNTSYSNCKDFQCKECHMLEQNEIDQIEYLRLKEQ